MCCSSRGARLPRVLLGTHSAHKCTLGRQYTLVHAKIKSSFLNRLRLSGLDLPFPSADTDEPHGAQCVFIRRIYAPSSLAQTLAAYLRRAGSALPPPPRVNVNAAPYTLGRHIWMGALLCLKELSKLFRSSYRLSRAWTSADS